MEYTEVSPLSKSSSNVSNDATVAIDPTVNIEVREVGKFPLFTLILFIVLWFVSFPLCFLILVANTDNYKSLTILEYCAIFIPIPPVAALEILLGIPRCQRELKEYLDKKTGFDNVEESQLSVDEPIQIGREIGRVNSWNVFKMNFPIVTLLTSSFVLSGALSKQFDPYSTASFVVMCFSVLGLLHSLKNLSNRTVLWGDLVCFVILWLTLDMRFYRNIWYGSSYFDYMWWSFAVSILVVYGWLILKEAPAFGYNLIPYPKSFLVTLLALIGFGLIVIPAGLGSKFLEFPPTKKITALNFFADFFDIFLGTAIPEELFYRNILQHGMLDKIMYRNSRNEDDVLPSPHKIKEFFKAQKWKSLLVASLFFGLMHWKKKDTLLEKFLYCLFASIAGMFYGMAFRLDGNNIFAPALTHTLVDTVWAIFLV